MGEQSKTSRPHFEAERLPRVDYVAKDHLIEPTHEPFSMLQHMIGAFLHHCTTVTKYWRTRQSVSYPLVCTVSFAKQSSPVSTGMQPLQPMASPYRGRPYRHGPRPSCIRCSTVLCVQQLRDSRVLHE